MPGIPTTLLLDGNHYLVAGAGTPRWQSEPVPSQEGEFARERRVSLSDGRAGIIGSRRELGQPASMGVGDVVNGDTSLEGVYGAGPGVTTISLSAQNSNYSTKSISAVIIGTTPISGPVPSATPTMIFGEKDYIYVGYGSRFAVIDPTDDSVDYVQEFPNVNGMDAANWASRWWIGMRGGTQDLVHYLDAPWDGSALRLKQADWTATYLHAGPDALYHAYRENKNTALVKKTTSRVASKVALDANHAPSSGETAGDPDTPITSLATLGERLVVGKEDGLGEFDSDFTFRYYLEWMRGFRWSLQNNAVLPLGQGGDLITTYRRGLYWLPINRSIGVQELHGNESDKKGRYTALEYDGTWLYAFLESTTTNDTHIIKMRRRTTEGPGGWEHHPIATLTDVQVLVTYLWPGGTIGGTAYGPRLYFGHGSDTLGYIRLGETQPDQLDSNYRFRTGAWNIDWPLDDFGTPATIKTPYKFEALVENASSSATITVSVSTSVGGTFVSLTDNGQAGGPSAIVSDGHSQRFVPRSNAIEGRSLLWRIAGTGSPATSQLRVKGHPIVSFFERPEMVNQIECTLQLQQSPHNPQDSEEQLRTLQALQGQSPRDAYAEYGEFADGQRFIARVTKAERSASVGPLGTILCSVTLRATDYSDG